MSRVWHILARIARGAWVAIRGIYRGLSWCTGVLWSLRRHGAELSVVADPDGEEARIAAVVAQTDPRALFQAILEWNLEDANELCQNLNAYDVLLRRGAPDAPALDLRRVPSGDKRPFSAMGVLPTNVIAVDRQGRYVVANPVGSRRLYGVRHVTADPVH